MSTMEPPVCERCGAAFEKAAWLPGSWEHMCPKNPRPCCDCGMTYEAMKMDVVIPNDQYERLGYEREQVPCVQCMVNRAKLRGYVCAFMSFNTAPKP